MKTSHKLARKKQNGVNKRHNKTDYYDNISHEEEWQESDHISDEHENNDIKNAYLMRNRTLPCQRKVQVEW